MGWEYVGLLHVDNNYGSKGALTFQRVARQRGVCVAAPVAISGSPTDVDERHLYEAFVQLIQQRIKVKQPWVDSRIWLKCEIRNC